MNEYVLNAVIAHLIGYRMWFVFLVKLTLYYFIEKNVLLIINSFFLQP